MVATGSTVTKKEEVEESSSHAAAGSSSQSTSNVKQEAPSDLAAAGEKRGSPGEGDDPPAKRTAVGLSSNIMQSGEFYLPNLCWPTRREGETKANFLKRSFVARFRNGWINTNTEANPIKSESLWGCPGQFEFSAPPPPLSEHQTAIASEFQLLAISGDREVAGSLDEEQSWGVRTGLGTFRPWNEDHQKMQIHCVAPEAFLDLEKHKTGVIIYDGTWLSNRERGTISNAMTHH